MTSSDAALAASVENHYFRQTDVIYYPVNTGMPPQVFIESIGPALLNFRPKNYVYLARSLVDQQNKMPKRQGKT